MNRITMFVVAMVGALALVGAAFADDDGWRRAKGSGTVIVSVIGPPTLDGSVLSVPVTAQGTLGGAFRGTFQDDPFIWVIDQSNGSGAVASTGVTTAVAKHCGRQPAVIPRAFTATSQAKPDGTTSFVIRSATVGSSEIQYRLRFEGVGSFNTEMTTFTGEMTYTGTYRCDRDDDDE